MDKELGVGRWAVEGSNNKEDWTLISVGPTPSLAKAVFDLEMEEKNWRFLRLVSPKGIEEERART